MSTVRRRRLAATALATTAALTLGGCGTGFDAQTNKVYQPAVGANHRGQVDAHNTLLVANEDGSATLSTSLVNNADTADEVVSVTATTLQGDELEVTSLDTTLALKPDVLSVVGAAADAGGFVVKDAAPGTYVELTITFAQAAPVTIEAPIVARTAEYATVTGEAPEPALPPEDAEEPADAEGDETAQ